MSPTAQPSTPRKVKLSPLPTVAPGDVHADPGVVRLKVHMLRHGISARELAQRAGLQLSTVRNVLASHGLHRKTRQRINAALAYPAFPGVDHSTNK